MLKAINTVKPRGLRLRHPVGFRKVRELMGVNNIATPFLVLSRSAIRHNLSRLAAALPGVGVRYAVKSNSHPAILEEIKKAGHGFDVASYREFLMSAEAGAGARDVIHSHPIKPVREIRQAVDSGIELFVVDNPDEVAKFTPFSGRVKLLIRLKAEGSAAVVNLSYKFGCTIDEAYRLARTIRDKGLDFYGLTFHSGSQCLSPDVYVGTIRTASNLIERLDRDGFDTRMLDIGGGFPVPYTEKVTPIEKFCRPIAAALTERIDPAIEVICEPGRYISATAVTLAASVIGKSIRSGRPWYFLDDGVYGSFSGRVYDHCKYSILTNRNTTWKRSVLAGPTCDSFDVIYRDIILPPLEIGDILLFPAMGAYSSVSASAFNSLRKAEYVVIE
jgi:ornithine decarboxylase